MNRDQFPAGGWQFHDPALKWSAPTPTSSTFRQTVDLIIKARRANPALVAKNNLAIDTENVGIELENFTNKRLGINALPKSLPPSLLGAAGAAVAAAKKLAAGATLLFSWQEAGLPPVPTEEANKRASICSGCPQNQPGHLTKFFTSPVAEAFRAKFQKLHAMNLNTPDDEKLGVCQACLCPLKLKVHCPMSLILKFMRPDVKDALDARCWILHKE